MKLVSSQDACFEVSWEVCNKVGGIHTVLSSKARLAVDFFGDHYFLLGPDLKHNPDFEETDEPGWQGIREACALKEIRCRLGRWKIPGEPKVILVGFDKKYNQGQLLFELWESFGVDSLSGGWDYIEPVMFSYACGEVIAAIYHAVLQPAGVRATAHFHEWMCGAGLLGVKKDAPEIGTVFTTHATTLGRTLAGSGVDIYRQMEQISPQREVHAHNIVAKFSMECAAARESDCFTTVSDITAIEARSFLGRTPDVITTNGLDMRNIPDFSSNRDPPSAHRGRILAAAARFLRCEFPADTRLVGISGRYEFHNKGIDVFLEALGGLEKDLKDSPHSVLALCMVLGGHEGLNTQVVQGDPAARSDQGPNWISTHRLYNQSHDPILAACSRLGLVNGPANKVKVIFIPAFLNGSDGFLNMPYFDVLSACDLGVFPSYYEPWGYTPQESAAYAVPSVTTDLAGFGMWVAANGGEQDGMTIIRRKDQTELDIIQKLRAILFSYASCDAPSMTARRQAVRTLAMGTSWEQFYPHYLKAYEIAFDKTELRARLLSSARRQRELVHTFAATGSSTPYFRNLTAVVNLPTPLARLRELAYNLWWTWNPEALELFAYLNPQLWPSMNNNPVRMLEQASPERLEALAHDNRYLELYGRTLESFDAYMQGSDALLPPQSPVKRSAPVAYFSTEYGLHECLPIYSGGLGVLSGDHLKAASDLGLPLVGIGLLYKNGFFRQRIDKAGWQLADFPENDFSVLPVQIVKDDQGRQLEIALDLPGRTLFARAWEIKVGRVTLYLLDSDVPKNTADDRLVTSRLYVADRHTRIKQELLLGMSGERLLRRLGIRPSCYHMNEGHSAFLTFERIRAYMQEDGLSYAEACELVQGNTLFTTHTPVEAGNETFPRDVIEYYFRHFVEKAGIAWSEFWDLGRHEAGDDKPFYMTVLGLKMASRVNAVSRLHGQVSRAMWQNVWKGTPRSQVPIGAITNGVHIPSYVAPRMRDLLDKYLGDHWERSLSEPAVWNGVQALPDAALWDVKCELKQDLLTLIRDNLSSHFQKYGASRSLREEVFAHINPAAMIIGFARRFAPYKRASLLLSNLERLDKIVNDPKRPVIVVFAGKAHPEDTLGIELIQKVVAVCNDPRFLGRVFFLEDYNLAISRLLLQGSDVWLNNPRRPYEACGTSGQKSPINGGINLSVSDGWWCEGYDGTNGWTIGPAVQESVPLPEASDEEDALSLYALLEDSVAPLYFSRDEGGLPHRWIAMVKRSMLTLVPRFSAGRMVREYTDTYYVPAASRGLLLGKGNYALARQLADWKRKIPIRFSSLRLKDIRVEGLLGDSIAIGQPLTVKVRIDPGKLTLTEILVQLVIGPTNGEDFLRPADVVTLKGAPDSRGALIFTGTHELQENGRYAYGIRVAPHHEGLEKALDSGLVLWG